MTRTRAFVTAVVFFVLSVSSGLLATEWHVAPPPLGDNGNPGTQESPFATIQRGIDTAANGDTVIVAQGTYVENINFNGKNIVLRSTNPADWAVVKQTIIDGNQAGSVVTFSGTENNTCALSGFTIRNGTGTSVSGPLGMTLSGGGVLGGTSSPNLSRAGVQNNFITGNSCQNGAGVFGCGGLMRNNIVVGNMAGNAFGDHGGGLAFCTGTIEGNLIAGNTSYCGGGISHSNSTIRNNTVVGNTAVIHASGLSHCGTSPYVPSGGAIRNNIVWGNNPPGLPQVTESVAPTYCCIQGWTGGGVGNIALDPEFADADYRLSPSSPCIDAGTNENWVWDAFDLDNKRRVLFGRSSLTVDMGAYEYYNAAIDGTPPYADGCDPAAGATNVAVNANVVLHVKDDGNGVDRGTIVVTLDGLQVTPAIKGTPTDYTVTYNPPSDFDYGQTVAVTVNAKDRCSPANIMTPVAYSFTTSGPPDTTPPVITLLGANPVDLEVGAAYAEPGYTATDNKDGDITGNVVVAGSVNQNVLGAYTLRYNVSDSSGNPAEQKIRTVNVVDTTPPEITLLGDDPLTWECGTPYSEPGYTGTDNYDGDITTNVVVTGSVHHNVLGDYTLRYNLSDSSDNPAEEKTRTVDVVDTTPPDITLSGDDPLTLEWGTPYVEPGYTATDVCEGDLTANVAVTGTVDHNVLGACTLRYNVSDSSGNPAEEKTRVVNVVDTTPPVIALQGDDPMTLQLGTAYVEPGYTAADTYDGDIAANVVITGSVDHNAVGTYILHYNVSDSSGNPAEEQTRTVNVVETRPFELLEVKIPAEGMIQLIWTSRPGDEYVVWSCTDLTLADWTEESTVVSAGDSTSWTDPSPGGSRKFYRVEQL